MRVSFIIISLLVLSCFSIVIAQDACDIRVETAIQTANQACLDYERNEICYGNTNILAQAKANTRNFRFEQVGDIADVTVTQNLRMSSMNTTTGDWGIALMKVQANLPDSFTSQDVQIVLFGAVAMINDGDLPDSTTANTNDPINFGPMQAFTFRSGTADENCVKAPNGILIQTPEGAGTIDILVNEVEIELGSTAYLKASDDATDLYLLEGSSTINVYDQELTVAEGTYTVIPNNSATADLQLQTQPYSMEFVENLPIGLLDRDIEIAEPWDGLPLDGIWEFTYDRPRNVCPNGTVNPAENSITETDLTFQKENWEQESANTFILDISTDMTNSAGTKIGDIFYRTRYTILAPDFVKGVGNGFFVTSDGRCDLAEATIELRHLRDTP